MFISGGYRHLIQPPCPKRRRLPTCWTGCIPYILGQVFFLGTSIDSTALRNLYSSLECNCVEYHCILLDIQNKESLRNAYFCMHLCVKSIFVWSCAWKVLFSASCAWKVFYFLHLVRGKFIFSSSNGPLKCHNFYFSTNLIFLKTVSAIWDDSKTI